MRTNTLYLHMGTHKTASTTIQSGCVENRAALLKAGWFYPTSGMYIFGQHNIAWELAQGRPHPWNHISKNIAPRTERGGLAELMAEIEQAGSPNVILSSEDYENLHFDRIERLRQQFSNFQVEVIVYLREQPAWLQSAWGQFIKSGFTTLSFNEWVNQLLKEPISVQRFFGRYDLLLEPWEAVFGKEHVHIRSFSKAVSGDNIFYDFLRTCRVDGVEQYVVPSDQNIAPGLMTLECSRYLSRDIHSPNQRMKVCRLVQEWMNEQNIIDGKFNLIGAELYERIQNHFAVSNQWVARYYLNEDTLFPVKVPGKVSHFTVDELATVQRDQLTEFVQRSLNEG